MCRKPVGEGAKRVTICDISSPHGEEPTQSASRTMAAYAVAPSSFETAASRPPQDEDGVERRVAQLRPMQHIWKWSPTCLYPARPGRGPGSRIRDVGCREGRDGSRARFHPRHRGGRSGGRPPQERGDALSPRAERLPAYRARQVDLPQFRHGAGVRRPLPPALRRHQPDQGGAGIHRRDRARRALARLRLGRAPLSRVGLFRAALRLGRGPDPRRQGLCGRPDPGGDACRPRHADRAGQEQPVPRAQRGGEPRPVPPHARGRVPERRARAARQDRHGQRQHQPARPGALPHPARHPSAHRHGVEDLSELRLRARPVRRDRGRHAFDLHARVRGSPAALRLVHREPARCRRGRASTSSRGSISPTRCCPSACSTRW